jgi:5'-nucleotidase
VKHILLTNDDGIEAPGLRALLQDLESRGQVSVLAPDHNWSAAGHTKTMHKPLRVRPYSFKKVPSEFRRGAPDSGLGGRKSQSPTEESGRQSWPEMDGVQAYVTSGAPSDCVILALRGILEEKPDLVVSGINQGANLGHDLTYSGTVAAAMEAVIAGVPAVAVSLDSYDCQDFEFAARVGAQVVQKVIDHGLPNGVFLNVNVPCLPAGEMAGFTVTRLGRRVYRDMIVERRDPRGQPYYWIGGEPPGGHLDEGTDIWAVANGYVSITPVHLDMTAHDLIPDLEQWRFGRDD